MSNRFERFTLDIFKISHAWNQLAGEEMKPYGLKGVSALYLLTLAGYPDGITVIQLAEVCGRDKADVSRTMTIMENKGLVKKNNTSGYRVPISLTDEGRSVVEHVNKRANLALEMAGTGLTDEKRAAMYESLEIITGNLDKLLKSGLPK